MKQLICEMCGSADLIKQDGVFVCQTCGCKYSVEEARKMMIEGTVSIDGVVKTKNDDFEVRAGELIVYHGAETDIIIPDGIKIIGEQCFAGMQGIESVIIPEGVYKIEIGAFYQCSRLRTVVFPKSLVEIGNGAFLNCITLAEVELPYTIKTLGRIFFRERNVVSYPICARGCFENCVSLKSIALPDGLQKIGDGCFCGCTSLEAISFSNIQILGRECLKGCTSLKSINLPGSLQVIGDRCCENFTWLGSIDLPDGIQKLGDECFKGCTSLKSMNLPASIQTFGEGCFLECTSLESVNVADGIQMLGKDCFKGCTSLKLIQLPNSLQELGSGCFGGDSIDAYNFSNRSYRPGCTSLKSVQLPDSIQIIGSCCFYNCTLLESIHISDNIQEIGNEAFGRTPALKAVELPISYMDSITSYHLEKIASHEVGTGDLYTQYVIASPWFRDKYGTLFEQERKDLERKEREKNRGCYIATAVYGSYDCPQVWTLRRYRDDTLAETWCGRAFIRAYYAISPILVKWFGHTSWFKKLWKRRLDRMVCCLNSKGVEDTPYQDRVW